ncbi:MAG: response regulator transcription factor [Rubrobacter sp.]|jgi:DNA-binding NarL/FixJ family response regulator|nr:response regulator transcription factor [Rubrobacter sp.]
MRTAPAQVLIADDHELVRDGFKRLLDYQEDFEVVGEVSDGWEAVELCRNLKPDLVLMDVRMPQMDGLEATGTIKAEQPEISVLVITTYENADYLLEAIKAGAAGYVLKDASNQRLLSAMRRALEGESPVDQELATQLIKRLASEAPQSAEPPMTERGAASTHPLLKELTPRELDVLVLVTQGKTNQEIAESLFITRATAKIHVHHIIRKLGVSDRTQAVVRAFELGLAPYPKTGP